MLAIERDSQPFGLREGQGGVVGPGVEEAVERLARAVLGADPDRNDRAVDDPGGKARRRLDIGSLEGKNHSRYRPGWG